MANIIEFFALVEVTPDVARQQPTAPTLKRIIRTYESKPRAEQDMELLSETIGTAYFDIIAIPHIES